MSIQKENFNKYIQHRGGYATIPNELWELKELDVYDKVIWAYVCSKKPDWSSSRNNIARNLNLSKDKVSDSVKKLVGLNMIEIYEGQNKSWCFIMVTPNIWSTSSTASGPQHLPPVNDPTVHTKEYNNKTKRNSFSQEGRTYVPLEGARGDQQAGNNSNIPVKDDFISPEARENYDDLIARGKTPADLGGMSLIEYANQRAHADSYPAMDLTKAIEDWQKRDFSDWDVEDIMDSMNQN